MEKISVDYEVSEILAEEVFDEDEDGPYSYWEEYDTLPAGTITVLTDEEETDTTLDTLIEDLKKALVEMRYLTEKELNGVNFSTKDQGLSFDIEDPCTGPLYRLIAL